MKKVLSVILATLVILSVFCVNAFAADAPKTDALLDKLDTATEVSVTLKAGNTKLFGVLPADISNTIAAKGNTVVYEYDADFIQVRVIANEKGIYAFIPSLPYFYVKLDKNPLQGADIWALIKDAANLTQGFIEYQKTYKETVDGVEYTVEEYNDREFVTSKFYYEGETLKMLKVEDSSTHSVQNTYFEEITFDADDSIFEVPVLAFDLTPILKGLFIAIIGA